MPRQKSLLRTFVEPLAIALALAALMRAAVQMYSIPSSSMAPTLAAGDQIVVTPYFGRKPQAGDIIVFRSPAGGEEMLVKRVIATPGDLVETRLGQVRIGGYTLPEPYVARPAATGSIEPQVVPPDAYFVLGDNRDESVDSRVWGAVPRSLIVGRARLVLWSSAVPLDATAQASERRPGRRSPRVPSRIFKWLH